MQKILLENGGVELVAHIFANHLDPTAVRRPVALFIHGWESNQDRMYDLALELSGVGYLCLTFDLRGHGQSSGNYRLATLQDFLSDCVRAYDFLINQENIDSNRVVVVGSSLGGYLAILLADIRKVQALVLRAPANYPDHIFNKCLYIEKQNNPEYERSWRCAPHTISENKALDSLNHFCGKVLLVESGNDEELPKQILLDYKNSVTEISNLLYSIMENAPHSLTKFPELKRVFNKLVIKAIGNWDL